MKIWPLFFSPLATSFFTPTTAAASAHFPFEFLELSSAFSAFIFTYVRDLLVTSFSIACYALIFKIEYLGLILKVEKGLGKKRDRGIFG